MKKQKNLLVGLAAFCLIFVLLISDAATVLAQFTITPTPTATTQPNHYYAESVMSVNQTYNWANNRPWAYWVAGDPSCVGDVPVSWNLYSVKTGNTHAKPFGSGGEGWKACDRY